MVKQSAPKRHAPITRPYKRPFLDQLKSRSRGSCLQNIITTLIDNNEIDIINIKNFIIITIILINVIIITLTVIIIINLIININIIININLITNIIIITNTYIITSIITNITINPNAIVTVY
jgi:hypothetical protein